MAQSDMNIANQGFPAFRADLNAALAALVSNSSGATAPSATFPHQFWVDTSANPSVLKQRNLNDDAWVTIGTIDEASGTFKVADGSVVVADITGLQDALDGKANQATTYTKAEVDSRTGTAGGLGFKNRLINAQGLINQRAYVSGTATTSANQYTVDRWRVVVSGQNLTFTTTNNEVTFTAPAGGIEQVIEGLNLESGTYVLNWEGTATATVGDVAVAKGGTVTVVGGTNTTVRFIGGTFIRPQFEAGSVATPFERRPYGAELNLCQRYFWTIRGDVDGLAAGIGAGLVRASAAEQILYCAYPATMRASPTLSGANITVESSALQSSGSLTGAFAGRSSARLGFSITGLTANTAAMAWLDGSTSASFLNASAEL